MVRFCRENKGVRSNGKGERMSKRGWILVASLLLWPLPASAEVGSAGDTRPPAPQQRPKWKDYGFSTQLTGNFLQGNANLSTLGASLDYNQNSGPHQFFLNASNFFNQAGATVNVNRISGSMMYAYGMEENLNVYGYTTHSHDSALRLDYRLTAGAGVCLHRLFQPDFSSFLVSLGPVSEWEWLQPGNRSQTWRSMLRLNATRPFSQNLELGVDAFYAPSLEDLGDFRAYGEGTLKINLSETVAFKLTAADEYHSHRPLSMRRNDLGLFSSIVASWGR